MLPKAGCPKSEAGLADLNKGRPISVEEFPLDNLGLVLSDPTQNHLGFLNVTGVSVYPEKMVYCREHLKSGLEEGTTTTSWLND